MHGTAAATLTNTNVYLNRAISVCSPSSLVKTFVSAPHWITHSLLLCSQGNASVCATRTHR